MIEKSLNVAPEEEWKGREVILPGKDESIAEGVLLEAQARIEHSEESLLKKAEDALIIASEGEGSELSKSLTQKATQIKERIVELATEAKGKIIDFRVRRAVRAASVERKSSKIYWHDADTDRENLKGILDTLSADELQRQSELLTQLQEEIAASYRKQLERRYNFSDDDTGTSTLSRIHHMLESHPEVFAEFTHTPDILEIKRDVLRLCLKDPYSSRDAKRYSQKLFIDDEHAQKIVEEAVSESVVRGSPQSDRAVYRVKETLEDFEIPTEERLTLAILSIHKSIADGHSDYDILNAAKKNFHLTREQLQPAVEANSESLKQAAYEGALDFMKTSGNRNTPPPFNKAAQLGIDIDTQEFKKYLELHKQEMHEIVIRWLTQEPKAFLTYRYLSKTAEELFLSAEEVQSMLDSDEARLVVSDVLQQRIEANKLSVSEIEEMARICGIDVETVRKNPLYQQSLQLLLEKQLAQSDYISLDEMVTFLNFDLEKIRPLAVSKIGEDFLSGNYRYLKLLDAFSLKDEEKEQVSVAAFGNPDQFHLIQRTFDYSQKFKEARTGTGWGNDLLTPDTILTYVSRGTTDLKFSSVDMEELVDILVHTKSPKFVKSYLRETSLFTTADKTGLVEEIITLYGEEFVVETIDSYDQLKTATVAKLVPALMDRDFDKALALNKSITPAPVPALSNFVRVVGSFGSRDLFDLFISSGEDEVLFAQKIQQVQDAFLDSDVDSLQGVLEDSTLTNIAKSFSRFNNSQWGTHGSDNFTTVIERYQTGKDSYAPLAEEYSPGVIEAFKQIKNKSQEGYTYSPEFEERWKTIRKSVYDALILHEKPFNSNDKDSHESVRRELYKRFLREVMRERVQLNEALQKAPNDKARESIENRISRITDIDVRTPEGMAEAFTKLYNRKKSPELAEIFRVYGFLEAADQQIQDVRPYLRALESNTPSADDISQVMDFVQHIAHREVWEKNNSFATSEVTEGLNSLFHVKALENELERMRKGNSKGEATSLQIVPSRGILTELSGHMGDACWASRYEILREYPNISSLSFFDGDKAAGSCLLIDTETSDGTPLTIIRGLNPLEAVINKLDIESFVDGIKTYVGEVAKQRNRKLAIVIDNHSGGSSTNRPFLYGYLSGLKHSLPRVTGLKSEDTTFNGYDITRDTFYLNS